MFCMRSSRRASPCAKACGIALMIAGLILMMIIVPVWAWAGVLCAALIVTGFILWHGA